MFHQKCWPSCSYLRTVKMELAYRLSSQYSYRINERPEIENPNTMKGFRGLVNAFTRLKRRHLNQSHQQFEGFGKLYLYNNYYVKSLLLAIDIYGACYLWSRWRSGKKEYVQSLFSYFLIVEE